MTLRIAKLSLLSLSLIGILSGCTESSPSEVVKKKCDHLKVIASHDHDLDEAAQPLARDVLESRCDKALNDCTHKPQGDGCKSALEMLSAAP